MHSQEQRKLATETLIRFDHSHADTASASGFPNRRTLSIWWKGCESAGEVPEL